MNIRGVKKLIEWYTDRSNTAKKLRDTLVERHRLDTSAAVGLRIADLVTIALQLPVEVPDLSESDAYTTHLQAGPPRGESRGQSAFISKLFKRVGKKRK